MNRQSNSALATVVQRVSGFTLIELLVVLFIAAIVGMIGIPAFQNIIADSRITSTSNDLISSFILARSEAIKRASFVTVCKSDNGVTCGDNAVEWEQGWIVFSNTSGATANAVDPGDQIIRSYPAVGDGITIRPVAPVDGFMAFRPAGTAGTTVQNLSGTLTLCDFRGANNARGIIMQNSGRVQVSLDLAHDGNALECP